MKYDGGVYSVNFSEHFVKFDKERGSKFIKSKSLLNFCGLTEIFKLGKISLRVLNIFGLRSNSILKRFSIFPLQVWINQGDIILVGLRDYQDAKADVILKYTPDEARNLKTYGEFPESVRINDTVTFVEDGLDEDIEFGDEISSEDDADSVDAI